MVLEPIDILVVDDEPDFAETLRARLEQRAHRVRVALSGPQALAALAEREPDVVVLDFLMPGMDGLAALREIKIRHPLVEVVLLTGHGSADVAVEGLRKGAFDYVEKPAELGELTIKLDQARDRRRAHEDRIRQAESRTLAPPAADD